MIKQILLILCFISSPCFAADNPVTAEDMASWLAFDRPVTFEMSKIKSRELQEWGKLIWCYNYSSKNQTLSSYRIALYEGGSLFGDKRAEMEKKIEDGLKEMKSIDSNRKESDVDIQTKPDGRKAFFFLGGFGPGGASYLAFTTLPGKKYDLLVMRNVDYEDDVPPDQKLKNPAKPTKKLTDIFDKIEKKICIQYH